MSIHIRDYQRQAIAQCWEALSADVNRVAVQLPTGTGKGHPLDTEVPTPSGVRLWGNLRVGDTVYGSDGVPTRVIAIYDRGILPTYRVTFSDGASVEVDADHLWNVRGHRKDPFKTMSTAEIMAGPLRKERGYRWQIPMIDRVHRRRTDLPIDPYVVGALIANGSMTGSGTVLTTPDPEVALLVAYATDCRKIKDTTDVCDRYSLPGLVPATEALGMRVKSAEKRIPRAYLNASADQRIGLLHGLMDGDGSRRAERRSASYHTSSPGLAEDVAELVTSLGGTASIKTYDRGVRGTDIQVMILLPVGLSAFRTDRKAQSSTVREMPPRRSIASIEPVGEKPIRCITVDADDSLYLITRRHIVTHNTITFAAAIDEWLRQPVRIRDSHTTERALVLVHTEELTGQAVDKIRLVTGGHWSVGVVKAERNETDADIVVASVQTLANPARRAQLTDVGLIVVDECFPAGTLVGGKPIETLTPGDLVPSWDESTGRQVMAPVVAVMKRKPTGMVRVTLDDGSEIDCTPSHPIMTMNGWCPAGGLWRGAQLVSFTHDATASGDMHRVHELIHPDDQGQDRCVSPQWANVLPERVPGRMDESGQVGPDVPDQPSARLAANDRAQPDGQFQVARQDGGHTAPDWTPTARPERQWSPADRAAAGASGLSGVAYGGGDRAKGRGAPVSLSGGHRAPVDDGGDRGGRGVALLAGPPSIRPAEGRTVSHPRVVGVQVLQPGSDGTYSGVCPDGAVYNIEVAGTHTYLIGNGLLVHNCHHATAPSYQAILEHYGAFCQAPDCFHGPERDCAAPVPVLGFTATLVRSDGQGLGRVWQELAFSRQISWAIRKGFLVDLTAYTLEVPELDAGASDAALDAMLCDSIAPEAVVTAWFKQCAPPMLEQADTYWPSTVLFAPLVKSAQAFADAFTAAGVKAEVVHGGLPAAERRAILERYEAGTTTVICNAMVLTEGWDAPRTKCVIVARPTQSVPLFVQMVGRGLRPWLAAEAPPRAEQRCVLLCVADSTTQLATIADLSDKPIQAKDGASLLAMEDEWDLGAHLAAETERAYAGPTVAREFDPLVERSSKVWAFTEAGTPFLPVGKTPDYVFLVQEASGWSVFWYAGGEGARRLVRDIPDLELAMALAEDEAGERGGDVGRMLADKGRAWRKERPSQNQMEMAVRVGIPVYYVERILASRQGGKAGRLADMITLKVATKRLDPMVERIHARAESVSTGR